MINIPELEVLKIKYGEEAVEKVIEKAALKHA